MPDRAVPEKHAGGSQLETLETAFSAPDGK
jgi:hypothetical protein